MFLTDQNKPASKGKKPLITTYKTQQTALLRQNRSDAPFCAGLHILLAA